MRAGGVIDDFEKILALGFVIAVNNRQHGGDFCVTWAAANQSMLAARDIAIGPRKGALIDRHTGFILLNTATHFSE